MAIAGKISRNPEMQQAVQQMARAGIPRASIARAVGIDRSSIGRYLDRAAPELRDIAEYASARADLLARQGALAQDVSSRLIEAMATDDLAQLSAEQKARCLVPLMAVQDRAHQQERLERGQSTANVQMVVADLSGFREE